MPRKRDLDIHVILVVLKFCTEYVSGNLEVSFAGKNCEMCSLLTVMVDVCLLLIVLCAEL